MTFTLESLTSAARQVVQAKATQKAAPLLEHTVREDWRPVAVVLAVDSWACPCGASGNSPLGLFLFSEHRRLANTTRLQVIRRGSTLPDLPRRHFLQPTRGVDMCYACAHEYAFLGFVEPTSTRPSRWTSPLHEGHFVQEWKALTSPESPQ